MNSGRVPAEVLGGYPPHDDTLYGLLASRSANAAHPFLRFGERTLSYPETKAQVDDIASRLHARGIAGGDRVAICAENHARSVLTIVALARVGATCVPVNPELGIDELAWILGHAGVAGVLTTTAIAPLVAKASASSGLEPWYACVDDDADPLWQPRDGVRALPEAGGAESTWVILYTSGTTGYPKGVMHSQRTFVLTGEAFVERMHLTAGDRMLCVLPLFHINALFYSLGGAMAAGATLLLERRFSASRFWQVAAETRATEVNIIAAVGHILVRRPMDEFRSDHSLIKVYGAPISAEIADVFRQRFGIDTLIEGYGLTEAPSVCTQPFDGPRRIGTIGIAARHPLRASFVALRVVDDAGRDVAPGEPGELLVRSPVVMQGYYRDPAQTRDAFVDGWLKTGDIVRRDADGCYVFVTRKKDIIRRRGENIAAAEVERVIKLHPAVRDAAVIAANGELGEDEILAVVLPVETGAVGEAEIADWCRERLARHKVPRYVALVAALPYTPSHRIAKHRLKADPALPARVVDLGSGGSVPCKG